MRYGASVMYGMYPKFMGDVRICHLSVTEVNQMLMFHSWSVYQNNLSQVMKNNLMIQVLQNNLISGVPWFHWRKPTS